MLTHNKYVAIYLDGTYIPIFADDVEDVAWLAKDLSDDYDTELVDIIPIW